MQTVSVDEAIRRGTRIVNWPVKLLLCLPAVVLLVGRKLLHIASEGQVLSFAVILLPVCFGSAWLWWSINVPKSRLWAYEQFADIPELKRRAVAAGLIWPDGSFFSRTEIKSETQAQRERELELAKSGSPDNRWRGP